MKTLITKKVISFSIWGSDSSYWEGAFKNIDLAHKLYPGWIVRFYHDSTMPMADRQRFLRRLGVELIPKQYYRDPWFGLYWRFCPMYDDQTIERFVVRDTDARISPREVDAVNEWIESGKPFHIMRDNTAHNIPILGGMWGAIPGCIPKFADNIRRWMHNVKGDPKNTRGQFHGTDQDFLGQYAWPHIKNNHIAHGIKYLGNERPFRVENPDGYKVGT